MITSIKINEKIIQLALTKGSIPGKCPFCDAEGHASTSSLGNRFFSLNQGEHHTNPTCIRLANEIRTADASVTNFDSLFAGLFRGQERNIIHGENQENNQTKENGDKEINENQLVPIRSLKKLAESQIMICGPNQITGNGEYITKYLLRPSWLPKGVEDKIDFKGNKIYEAYCLGVTEYNKFSIKRNSIAFSMKWNNFGEEIYLRLEILADDHTFSEFCKKYCETTIDEHERVLYKPKKEKRRMLVAGIWNKRDCGWKKCNHKDQFGCQSCLGNYSSAATSMRQFFSLN